MNLLVILTVVEVIVALALIGLVLLQQGKGADAGAAFGGGASGTVFGAAGGGNFLTRVTAILAVAFFALTLTLAYLAGQVGSSRIDTGSVTDQLEQAADDAEAKAQEALDDTLPALDDAPAAEEAAPAAGSEEPAAAAQEGESAAQEDAAPATAQ